MLRRVREVKNDRYLWVEIFDILLVEIVFGIKNQPISAFGKLLLDQKERFDAPVVIGPGMTQLSPRFIRVLNLQTDCHAAGRRTARDVEYVRRDRAHRFGQ